MSKERFGALSGFDWTREFLRQEEGACTVWARPCLRVRFSVDGEKFRNDPVYRARTVDFARLAPPEYDRALAKKGWGRDKLPSDVRSFLNLLSAVGREAEALDGNTDLRKVLRDEFGITVVENDRRFEDWMLREAALLLRSLPKEYTRLVKNLIRTEKCPTGKCAVAGSNHSSGKIEFYDSFYDPAAYEDHEQELSSLGEIERFRGSFAHEIAHFIVHEKTHVDFERLKAFYRANRKAKPFANINNLRKFFDAERGHLEETLMFCWASINGWSIPTLEKPVIPNFPNDLLIHMQGKDHGYKLFMRNFADSDGKAGKGDKDDDDTAFILSDMRWKSLEMEWTIRETDRFVTHTAADPARGPEESLVDTIAYFIANRDEFAERGKSDPILQSQFDFIRKDFFGSDQRSGSLR